VTKTLLAVDDSVTMRKVLEITFSGEDFKVVTADSSQGALGRLAENPQIFVIDTSLGGEDGYSLAKELRRRSPSASIIMLASRYAPYDQARGRDAGADDWSDKPFDTQQLIDKVKKVLSAKEAGGAGLAAPVAAAAAPYRTPAAPAAAMPQPVAAAHGAGAPPRPAPSAPGLGRSTQPSLSNTVPQQRTGTLVFGGSPMASPPAARHAAPAPAPAVAVPAPMHAPAPAAAAVNGAMAPKLGELGLTKEQTEAVLALSREIVERVVWEVVPQLAETLIKEELARLTRD
jgi:CheY-like chemotaxis protein